jgi:hypothetical protein
MLWMMQFKLAKGRQVVADPDVEQFTIIQCAVNPDHVRTTRRWDVCQYVDPAPPDKPIDPRADALYSTSNAVFLLRVRAIEALRAAGLTGFVTTPAKITRRNGEVMTDFHEFRVSGFGGIASQGAGCRLLWRCSGCGLRKYGDDYRFDVAASEARQPLPDFFVMWPLSHRPYCSERARQVLSTFEVSEIDFTDAAKATKPARIIGDTPVPPYFEDVARSRIEAFWAQAPLGPPPAS